MSKKAAPADKLGELHAKVAEVMLQALDSIQNVQNSELATDDEGNPIPLPEPSPALLGAITKFLKDNSITCNTEDSQTLSKLQERLAQKPKLAPRAPAPVVPLRELPVTEDDSEALKKLGLA